MPTFIFKSGGNGQTVKMSESISQSLTSTETSEVCDAVKSETFVCTRMCDCLPCLFVCVSRERAGSIQRANIYLSFDEWPLFLAKITDKDKDCHHLGKFKKH